MRYLTTLAVAQQIGVSKQTLLNWLYDGKVPEPPRNKKGYRVWSPSRVSLVRKLIDEGRIHRRTVIHKPVSSRPGLVAEFAREVSQFLRDAPLPALPPPDRVRPSTRRRGLPPRTAWARARPSRVPLSRVAASATS